MVGVNESSLRESLSTSAGINPSKLAEMLMNAGFDAAGIAAFAQDGVPDTAIAAVAV